LVLADAMKAGIRARIESLEYEPGLPTAEREAALAEINERLLAAELEEEDIVRQAAAAGLTLHRRPDCSPAAVLRWDPAARTFDEDVLLDIEGRARRARAALSQIGREYVDLRADLRSVEEAVWRTCRRAPRGAH